MYDLRSPSPPRALTPYVEPAKKYETRQMYELQDLKMNIKFEIEMLCQKFGVTLSEVPKYGRLGTRMTPHKEKNPDFNLSATRAAARAEAREREEAAAAGNAASGQEGAAAAAAEGGGREDGRGVDQGRGAERTRQGQKPDQQTVIPNLASYVTINPTLEVFATQPHLKQVLKSVVPIAVDRAIREIIQPVVERSVTIACITSKELVQKDFAMESDENKMRKVGIVCVCVCVMSGCLHVCGCWCVRCVLLSFWAGKYVGYVILRSSTVIYIFVQVWIPFVGAFVCFFLSVLSIFFVLASFRFLGCFCRGVVPLVVFLRGRALGVGVRRLTVCVALRVRVLKHCASS